MTRPWLLGVVLALIAVTVPVATATSFPGGGHALPTAGSVAPLQPMSLSIGKSHNFSGYAVTHDGKVSIVKASFKVPQVHGACPTKTEGAFFGVEVDGVSTPAPAFAATESYCSAGTPGYASYLYLYPYAFVGTLSLAPGDRMTATISYLPLSHTWIVQLQDHTRGTSSTKQAVITGAARAEARWGVFTGFTSALTIAPLVNFGNATFWSCYGTINGTSSHAVGHYPVTAVEMYNKANTAFKAAVSALSSNNLSFYVLWKSTGP